MQFNIYMFLQVPCRMETFLQCSRRKGDFWANLVVKGVAFLYTRMTQISGLMCLQSLLISSTTAAQCRTAPRENPQPLTPSLPMEGELKTPPVSSPPKKWVPNIHAALKYSWNEKFKYFPLHELRLVDRFFLVMTSKSWVCLIQIGECCNENRHWSVMAGIIIIRFAIRRVSSV